ncbi:hypothetical protein BDF14DRAFT_1790079 [Spinellus fusiger]|nr:hypothetical protein BDF14DRAFT_1790079 [Spinellus fusiger]
MPPRLDEPSQDNASIHSRDTDPSSFAASWKSDFLQLMADCIQHSEELESISTELLATEGKIRNLICLQQSINSEYEEREKRYRERLWECEQAAQQQGQMMESLEDLRADLDMEMAAETSPKRSSRHRKLKPHWRRKSKAGLLDKERVHWLYKLRWEMAMLLGGSVGHGKVIHTFESPVHGLEMMIAGSGFIAHSEERHGTAFTVLHRHHYMLHLLPRDRKSKFILLPRHQWVPDKHMKQCQFEHVSTTRSSYQCTTQFSFLQRRHHCRRCGKVVCQRHSSNCLPLFRPRALYDIGQWSRVCDACFQDLVVSS